MTLRVSEIGPLHEVDRIFHFKHFIETHLAHCIQHLGSRIIGRELPDKNRGYQCDVVMLRGQGVQPIVSGVNGPLGTGAETLTAINTPLGLNTRVAIHNADGLRGTDPHTTRTTDALVRIDLYRVRVIPVFHFTFIFFRLNGLKVHLNFKTGSLARCGSERHLVTVLPDIWQPHSRPEPHLTDLIRCR